MTDRLTGMTNRFGSCIKRFQGFYVNGPLIRLVDEKKLDGPHLIFCLEVIAHASLVHPFSVQASGVLLVYSRFKEKLDRAIFRVQESRYLSIFFI